MPSIDPIKINTVRLKSGGGAVSLDVAVRDVVMTGNKNIKCDKATGFQKDFNGKSAEIKCTIPVVKASGTMKIVGKVVVMSFNGESKSTITFDTVVAGIKFQMKSVKKGGQEYMQAKGTTLDLKVSK